MADQSSSPLIQTPLDSSIENSPNEGIPSPKSNRTFLQRHSGNFSETSLQDTSLDHRELQEIRDWREQVVDTSTPTHKHTKISRLTNLLDESDSSRSQSSRSESSHSEAESGSELEEVEVEKTIPPPAKKLIDKPGKFTQSALPQKPIPPPLKPAPLVKPTAKLPVRPIRQHVKPVKSSVKPSVKPSVRSSVKPAVNPLLIVPGLVLGLLLGLKIMLDTTGKLDKLHYSIIERISDSFETWSDVIDKIWFRLLEWLS
jgi:hypothetical protein